MSNVGAHSFFRTPEQCPHVVSLLSESFNPHVRCGSAMALGISCAGTGNKVREAIVKLRETICGLLLCKMEMDAYKFILQHKMEMENDVHTSLCVHTGQSMDYSCAKWK